MSAVGFGFCLVPVIDQVVCVLVLRQQHIISETIELLVYSAVTSRPSASLDGSLRFVLAHKAKKKYPNVLVLSDFFFVHKGNRGELAAENIRTF